MVVVRPFEQAKMNFQETVNEFTILTVACLFFSFCDLVPDYDTKDRIGWAVIFVILGNILFNLVVMVIEIFLGIRRFLIACREKRRKARYNNSEQNSKETINKFMQNKNNANAKVLEDVTMQDFIGNEESKIDDDFDNLKKDKINPKSGKKEDI